MNSITITQFDIWKYHDNIEPHFALCEECLWSATIFKLRPQKTIINLGICPVCFHQDVTLVPLAYMRLYNAYLNPHFGKKVDYYNMIIIQL
jgi:hypothetical protein